MQAQSVAAAHDVDEAKTSPLQVLTLVLCFLVVAADGFDVASVGYVAPLLQSAWSLTPAQLGPIFGAGLFGLTVGSFLFGPLADRIGRKRVIVISLILFGVGSLACAVAPSAGIAGQSWMAVIEKPSVNWPPAAGSTRATSAVAWKGRRLSPS